MVNNSICRMLNWNRGPALPSLPDLQAFPEFGVRALFMLHVKRRPMGRAAAGQVPNDRSSSSGISRPKRCDRPVSRFDKVITAGLNNWGSIL